MKGSYLHGQCIKHRAVDGAIGQQATGQSTLRKFTHLDGIVDDVAAIAAAAKNPGARLAAADRHHIQVKLRCKAAIQVQLFIAEMFARRQLREIKEAQVERLLDLVGIVAREDHPRNMRFQQLETVHRVIKSVAAAQRRDPLRLR